MNQSKDVLTPSADIVRVHESLLRRDPDNYRRTYPAASLVEMAATLLEDGILQNLECDPSGTVHMGNRRLVSLQTLVLPGLDEKIANLEAFAGRPDWAELAMERDPEARLAELKSKRERLALVPVRVLSWEEAKDAKLRQIVENLQREGVSATDEAEGYARLLEERDEAGAPRWTAESIAKRIGKGRTAQYVGNRLKLLRAPRPVLDALEAGRITIRTAELVGRVPSPEARKEVAGLVLNPRFSDKPLSERETAELIRERFMISLQKASFDPEDETLVEAAGRCSVCPHRSGNDPSLEGEVQGSREGTRGAVKGVAPDLCTNPTCFRAKCDAAWKRTAAVAEREGFEIMDEEVSEKIFNSHNGELAWNAPWVDLDDKPDHEFAGNWENKKAPKWRAVLKDSGIRITKARNPVSGRIHDMVKKSAAKEAVRVMREAASAPVSGKSPKQAELSAGMAAKADRDTRAKDEAAKARREAKIKLAMAIGGSDAILDAMTVDPSGPIDFAAMLEVLEIVLDDSADGCAFVAQWFKLERPHAGASGRDYLPAIMERVRGNDYQPKELFAFIAFAAIARDLKWQGIDGRAPKKLAKVLGVDLAAAGKAARAEFVAAEKRGKGKDKERGGGGDKETTKAKGEGIEVIAVDEVADPPEARGKGPLTAADEKQLIALEIAIQASDRESVCLGDIRAWAGGAEIDHAERLMDELVARGVIDEEGNVLEIPNWRKDAVGNRRANDFYEATIEAGETISLAEVEVRFGLKDKALATYRKNQNRGAKGKGGREG